MVVNITSAEVATAIRAGSAATVRARVGQLLAEARYMIERVAPDAPTVMHNRAAVQMVQYDYDRPNASGYTRYANTMRHSGAGTTLLPWRVIRAGSVALADTPTAATPSTTTTPETPIEPTPSGNPSPGAGVITFDVARVYVGWIEPDAVRVTTTDLNNARIGMSTDALIPAFGGVGPGGKLFFAVRNTWGAPPGGVALDGVAQGTGVYMAQAGVLDDSATGEYKVYLFNAALAVASFADGDRVLSLLGYPADIETNPTGADPEPEEPPEDDTPTDVSDRIRYTGWMDQLSLVVEQAQWDAAVRHEGLNRLPLGRAPAGVIARQSFIAIPTVEGYPPDGIWLGRTNPDRTPTGPWNMVPIQQRRTVGGVEFTIWTNQNAFETSLFGIDDSWWWDLRW